MYVFHCHFPGCFNVHFLLTCGLDGYQIRLVFLTLVVMPRAIWKVIFLLSLAEIFRFP